MQKNTVPQGVLRLSGRDWSIYRGGESELSGEGISRIPATVPGNIQSDLENARLLTPLWYGEGDPGLLDVCLSGWWYEKRFFVPDDGYARHTLVLEGVDYACELYLNGVHLGHREGMFLRFFVDVTEALRPGEENLLKVFIHPMPEELAPWLVNSDGKLSGEGTDYFFVEANNAIRRRLKGLKSPANCSYDWGTNIYTLGLWKDVYIESTGSVRIDYLQIKTVLSDGYEKAAVTPVLELCSAGALSGTLRVTVSGPGCELIANCPVEIPAGPFKLTGEALTIENPALWWPTGHGEQSLYSLKAELLGPDGGLLHSREASFGLREVRWEQVEGAPQDFPNPFALVLNGRRIRTMGSNIVSPDLLPGRIDEKGVRVIELAKECGMNTLRQHGGQVIYPDEMYDAADRLGVLLLVDFPIANCVPENEPVFLENFSKTVSDIVKQLRNHPAIVEWSGGNELNWYFDQSADHTALRVQEQAVSSEDDRVFRPTCPIPGSRHAPWVYTPELHYDEFNRDITDNFGEIPLMRYGEFGCQTPANLETWLRDIPEASRWPISNEDPVLIRKNAVQAVFSPHAWLMLPTIEDLFGPMESIGDCIKAGQFLGAEGTRYMMDALRAMGKRLGGFTNWDYNEPWPNGAGSFLVDYDGVPVMMYHFVKQALAPVALQLKYDSLKFNFFKATPVQLRLVSDAPERMAGLRWKAVLRDRFGKVYLERSGRADIDPLETAWLSELDVTPPAWVRMGPVFCELTLRDNGGAVLGERLHVFAPQGVEHPLSGLLYEVADRPFGVPYVTTGMVPGRVKQTELVLEESRFTEDGENEYASFALKNTGEMTALFVKAEPMTAYRTDLFIDNDFCFIPPGESRTISVRCRKNGNIPLSRTGFAFAGWNTNAAERTPDEKVLLYMGTRNHTCREYAKDGNREVRADGRSISPEQVRYLADGPVSFLFDSDWDGPAVLTLNLSDTSKEGGAVRISLGGFETELSLPEGYGLQKENPEQLAQSAALTVRLPAGSLSKGSCRLKIELVSGWFTWDSLFLEHG